MPPWLFSQFPDNSVYPNGVPLMVTVVSLTMILTLYALTMNWTRFKVSLVCSLAYAIGETLWNAGWEYGWHVSTITQWNLMVRPSTGMQFDMNLVAIPWMVWISNRVSGRRWWIATFIAFPLLFWIAEILMSHLGMAFWNLRPYRAYEGDYAYCHGSINLPMYPLAAGLGWVAHRYWDKLLLFFGPDKG